MTAPQVSVIIPTYNRAALVCEAIRSVLRQHWRDYEIIVVDDGSDDATPQALAAFGDRIRCLRQDHAGVHAARNRALESARGDYIAPLDSDDLWEPWKLGLMVAVLNRFPDAGFAFSNFSHLRQDGSTECDGLRRWHLKRHRWEDVFGPGSPFGSMGIEVPGGIALRDFQVYAGDIYRWSLAEHWVNPCSALIRKARLLPGERFPDVDPWSGEIEFFARLSHRCGAVFVDQETVVNRSHDDGLRLTRVDPALQLASRVALIDRLWRADREFMREHASDVNQVQLAMLIRLAGLLIGQGRRRQARDALKRANALHAGRPVMRFVLAAAARLPGSRLPVQALRRARSAVHGRHHSSQTRVR
ncbi:MAG TPA: glycosyltransferase [Steroidobacteraceae bacterium]|nr:glycosyltransferase [Steroidobacteraceae bacterium]